MNPESTSKKKKQQLYLQIADKVLEIIESRGLQAHDPVPSEGELAKLFGVSRMTSKLALEQLVERGLVYRLPRRGTFLSGNRHEESSTKLQEPVQNSVEKNENKQIALVVPHMSDYTSRIISAVEHEVRKHEYDLILKISKDEDDQDRCLQALVAMGISGIILFPWGSRTCSDQVFRLKMEKVPCVVIDRIFREIPIDCVYHDHFQGSYEMAQYLIAKGHREIGYSSNVIENITSREERYQGYIQALLDHGIPVKSEYIHFRTGRCDPGRFHEYDAEQGEFIRNNPQMTAVMCADDQVAIATLFSALHMNISVPEKLSIVGFSDTYLSALTPIPLTTVRQDTERLAAAAVELLMKRVNQSKEQHLTIKIQTNMVERKSVFDRRALL
ncbi:GntR family transcriptional regulator [Paenibacillus sp. 32O-W]|uniref:GntR family transcriptional regulator n=1 Tax=Paenibacillus sp. 32O-W TaxID=1695218 RepID=UPI00071FD2A4|nr:GntR family transcriptional regulator [Paenibacillus sp. 32O-W]ALS25854.1 GntR family transcriptional regulator [Paenibacillus sp. 32O-W]